MGEAAFRGDKAFCSNFYPSPVVWQGVVYATVEHAFASAKTRDLEWRERIRAAITPGAAKKLGRQAPLRPDWEERKVNTMRKLLYRKFEDSVLADSLLETGDEPLVERNFWHDCVWGKCYCPKCGGHGKNMLGSLLMEVRAHLRKVREG